MNESRSDGYAVLAICIATAAILASAVNAYQSIRDFDPDAVITLSIVGNVFSQASLALAMVCAVIIGRTMLAPRPTHADSSEEPKAPTDRIDDLASLDAIS